MSQTLPEKKIYVYVPFSALTNMLARKILKKKGEKSGGNPGRKFEKFGELSSCNFPDLKMSMKGKSCFSNRALAKAYFEAPQCL